MDQGFVGSSWRMDGNGSKGSKLGCFKLLNLVISSCCNQLPMVLREFPPHHLDPTGLQRTSGWEGSRGQLPYCCLSDPRFTNLPEVSVQQTKCRKLFQGMHDADDLKLLLSFSVHGFLMVSVSFFSISYYTPVLDQLASGFWTPCLYGPGRP